MYNVVYCMSVILSVFIFFFFFKQKTAYEMRISDWSSDVCSSDLAAGEGVERLPPRDAGARRKTDDQLHADAAIALAVEHRHEARRRAGRVRHHGGAGFAHAQDGEPGGVVRLALLLVCAPLAAAPLSGVGRASWWARVCQYA